jgi:hypothetical protein
MYARRDTRLARPALFRLRPIMPLHARFVDTSILHEQDRRTNGAKAALGARRGLAVAPGA